jgi:hypothetical protein
MNQRTTPVKRPALFVQKKSSAQHIEKQQSGEINEKK